MISIDRLTVGRDTDSGAWAKWIAGALCALGFVSISDAAVAQTRTLKIQHVHTGEKAEIVYRRGNSYDSAGLKKASYMLRDWRKNQPTKMNPKLLDILWEVHRNTGATGYIQIIGGYRSPATNSMLRSRSKGVAKKSQHILGNAVDFYIPGVKLKTLRNAGLALQAGGVGYYPSSGSPFVHMDVGRVRTWGGPGISQTEMASILKGGKRLGSGGTGMAAYADSNRSPGLLARLFGGGADEEEDNEQAGVRTKKADPAPAVKKPAEPVAKKPVEPVVTVAAPPKPDIKVVPPELATPAKPNIRIVPPDQATPVEAPQPQPEVQPEEIVETPQTIIAALPARKVPKPLFAPRPQVDVGTADAAPAEIELASASQVAALIGRPETALPANAPSAPVGADRIEAAGAEVAANQSVTPVVPEAKPVDVALGIPLPTWRPKYSPAPEVDSTALLALAAVDQSTPSVLSDAITAVPTVRPDAVAGTTTAEMTGAIPVQTAPKQARASATKPVKTTRKAARPNQFDGKPDRKAVVVAAQPKDARWALDENYVKQGKSGTKAPSYAYNIVRTAPSEVYVAGFQQGASAEEFNRFSGKAVKFLQVAKFQGN